MNCTAQTIGNFCGRIFLNHTQDSVTYCVGTAWSLMVVLFLLLLSSPWIMCYYWGHKKVQDLMRSMYEITTTDLKDFSPGNLVQIGEFEGSKVFDADTKFFTRVAVYNGTLISLKQYKLRKSAFRTRINYTEMRQFFRIHHRHICKFYGLVKLDGIKTKFVTEYCERGSLRDFFNSSEPCHEFVKNSIICDIALGMNYIHNNKYLPVSSHGNLKPSNCLIDGRLVVKISDFGFFKKYVDHDDQISCVKNIDYEKLWTAPEHLRCPAPPQGTQKGDVYSFSIIAQENFFRKGPFYCHDYHYSPKEIINRISHPCNIFGQFRPTLRDDNDVIINEVWRDLLTHCWSEVPSRRPSFSRIVEVAQALIKHQNLYDSMVERLEKTNQQLELKVHDRTQQFKLEKARADALLHQMLPKSVAEKLKANRKIDPEHYDACTIFFSDIVGFSRICHESSPFQVVQMLNDLYTLLDSILDGYDVYKVETIGDAYMVVSGVPGRNGNSHAVQIASMALSFQRNVLKNFTVPHQPGERLFLRIGIHSGPVVAGVVGKKMPRYCLFGDTVNFAARMEQTGESGKIHVSNETKMILDRFSNFKLTQRKDKVKLKGIGEQKTWWLLPSESDEFPTAFPNIYNKRTLDANRSSSNNIPTWPSSSYSERHKSLYGNKRRRYGICHIESSTIVEEDRLLAHRSNYSDCFVTVPGITCDLLFEDTLRSPEESSGRYSLAPVKRRPSRDSAKTTGGDSGVSLFDDHLMLQIEQRCSTTEV